MEFPRGKKRLTALGIILLAATANFIGIGHSLSVRWWIYCVWVIALVMSGILLTKLGKRNTKQGHRNMTGYAGRRTEYSAN